MAMEQELGLGQHEMAAEHGLMGLRWQSQTWAKAEAAAQ
jgi:hypothetical protein